MKRTIMMSALAMIAACGGLKRNDNVDDAAIVADASVDARVDARPDAPADAPGPCDPLANTGCAAANKCSWIVDVDDGTNRTGHVGCVPKGPKSIGEVCMIGTDGRIGSDNCAGGLYCVGRVCKQVCDTAGGAPRCAGLDACATYSSVFSNTGEAAVAGVCDATCDPLSQTTNTTPPHPNCDGGLNANNEPTKGCYGFWALNNRSRFSCASNVNPTFTQGHVFPAGTAFINSCAPGFFSLIFERTGSMNTMCSAHCFLGDVYLGHTAERGGRTIPNVKSTCASRGADSTDFDCIGGYSFEADTAAGTFAAIGQFSNVGVCLRQALFNDPTGVPNKPCSQLPDGTNAANDAAFKAGCRRRETYPGAPFAQPQMSKLIRPAYPATLSP
jgi:hypothetical protein